MTNKQIVQDMYDAFGKADIARLLSHVSDHCEWSVPGSKAIPTAGVFKGKQQIGTFFKTVGETMAFKVFEPRVFIAEGDNVAVQGRYTASPKGHQESGSSDWAMVFTLQHGKLVRFQEYYDTGSIERVFEKVLSAKA